MIKKYQERKVCIKWPTLRRILLPQKFRLVGEAKKPEKNFKIEISIKQLPSYKLGGEEIKQGRQWIKE